MLTFISPDEEPSNEMDPFWPVLQCFMVILDCLGSRFWGQIEPSQAFQAITQSPSYSAELESIRQQTMMYVSLFILPLILSYCYFFQVKHIVDTILLLLRRSRVKTETTYDDDMVTCSQMVYDNNTKVSKVITPICCICILLVVPNSSMHICG